MQEQHDCILARMWGMAISWAVGKMTGRRTVVQAEDYEGMNRGTAGMRGAVNSGDDLEANPGLEDPEAE